MNPKDTMQTAVAGIRVAIAFGIVFSLSFGITGMIHPKKEAIEAFCPEDNFTYGRIKDLTEVSLQHVFEIKNTGSSRIVITKVLTSCGCLVTSGGKGAINPGGTTEVPTNLSLADTVGTKRAHVLLLFEDGSTKRIDISAEVPDQVLTFPPKLVILRANEGVSFQLIRKTLFGSSSALDDLKLFSSDKGVTTSTVLLWHRQKANHDTIIHIANVKIADNAVSQGTISLVAVYGDGFKVPLLIQRKHESPEGPITQL